MQLVKKHRRLFYFGVAIVTALLLSRHYFSKDVETCYFNTGFYGAPKYEDYATQAEQGDAKAQAGLGMYYSGHSEHIHWNGGDNKLAYKWSLRAAEQGNTDAQFRLGTLLHKGYGVEKNPKEAYFWLYLATRPEKKEMSCTLKATYIEAKDELWPWERSEIEERALKWHPVLEKKK